jgi:hypothetical protein
VKLIRLERHQHPTLPHHELRQKRVLDLEGRLIGQVANLYVHKGRADRPRRVVPRHHTGRHEAAGASAS